MNNRELQSRLKNRSRLEAAARAVNAKLDVVKALIGISWFVALGRFCNWVAEVFRANGQYFFLLSMFLGFISLIISTIEYGSAGNKNLGKTANFLYGLFSFLVTVGVVVGFVVGGAFVGGILLAISMFIDPVVNLGRAIYCGIRAVQSDNLSIKYFLKQRAFNHVAIGIISALISAAFMALMMFAAMPLGLAVAIGAVGIGVMIVAAVFVPKLITKLMGPEPTVVPSPIAEEVSNEAFSDDEPLLAPIVSVKSDAYYSNSVIVAPASLAELNGEILGHIQKIEGDDARGSHGVLAFVWSQGNKRRDKIGALNFLQTIIHDSNLANIPEQATEEEPFRLGGYPFHYKEKIELCEAIAWLVLDHFPGAFQSAYKEVGDTEACFNKLFLCIIENNALLKSGIDQENDREYKLRGAHAL